MQEQRVYDYINNIISLAEKPEEWKQCNFAILCDKFPIQLSRNKFLGKVIYISLKTEKKTWRIYPDKIKKYEIEHVIINANSRRRLHYKMNEFFINGSNQEQIYEEHSYYNYSIENASKQTKELIIQLREKYNLNTPELYIGESQPLVLE